MSFKLTYWDKDTHTHKQVDVDFDIFILSFSRSLNKDEFESLLSDISSVMWGNPIRFGNTKVHIYGVDYFSYHQVWLDVSEKKVVVIIPTPLGIKFSIFSSEIVQKLVFLCRKYCEVKIFKENKEVKP
jgi:hypothetical protein